MNQLAVQMYTLREFTKTREGLAECFEVIHGIGYAGVQLSAVGCMDGDHPEVSPAEARAMLDANGLRCVATHRGWDRLRDYTAAEIEFHRILGCDYTAIGGLWGAKTSEDYDAFVTTSQRVCAELGAAGIRFGYHNHAHEFIMDRARGKRHYDLLIDAPHLMLEVDTYWLNHAGLDVAAFIRQIPGRIQVIHVKDKEVLPDKGPVMAPVGEGNLHWDGILDACRTGGTEWYVVEQDDCYRDPFDCLSSSFDFLAARGLAG
ncbi:MAG: sugar phosphate isomerase/epimerase [Fimbriimonadaceae bacterium]|nr:sugar phosphate isomerase/epimerase [Fimbriimonadaceae bacterium]